jgi:hydrogenase maturation protease
MMHEPTQVLVLGLGNVLCGDDGAGVVAVHLFNHRYVSPGGVYATDGGTLGLSLLPLVDGAERVILVDAIRADAPPGTLVRLTGAEVGPAVYERLSPHQIGVSDLLAGATLVGRYPTEVILLGIVPESIELGCQVTPAVDSRIEDLIGSLVDELNRLGYPPRPRTAAAQAIARSRDDVARVFDL